MERSHLSASNRGRVISIPERGETKLDRSTWLCIEKDDGFWSLVEHDIVSVRFRTDGVALRASCYVGRAICSDCVIEFREKIPGALNRLLIQAGGDAFRIERFDSPTGEFDTTMRLLIEIFLGQALAYVTRGRGFRYIPERRTGTLVGGKLDITQCCHLRARGLRHLLAFTKDRLSYQTPVNRIVFAALREIDRLSDLFGVPSETLARTRGLAMLFSDCRDVEVVFGRRQHFVEMAHSLIRTSNDPLVIDLLTFSALILSHESFEPYAVWSLPAPRAWFLNLENLFEKAVRQTLRDQLPRDCTVIPGAQDHQYIFSKGGVGYRAHPDLVISGAKRTLAIGDVKYKNWEATADPADIYQLLVHTAAFKGSTAFLVYPHDRFEMVTLGESVTGARTHLFAVDIRHLERDMAQVAEALGIRSIYCAMAHNATA